MWQGIALGATGGVAAVILAIAKGYAIVLRARAETVTERIVERRVRDRRRERRRAARRRRGRTR